MASSRRYFKFNLLPGRPKEYVKLEEQRDNTTLYGFLMVAFASLIYLVVILVQLLLVQPQLDTATQNLAARQLVKQSYADVQALNGELFIKTKTLKPVLQQNLDTAEIFRVTEAIKGGRSDLIIEDYNREKTGTFVFTVVSPNISDVPSILATTQKITGISDVFIRNISVDSGNQLAHTTLALNITGSKV